MLALTNNISADAAQNQPCKLAITALFNAIDYTSSNFQVEGERDHIMNKIFEALKSQDVTIREKAMMCLVSVGVQEYESVGKYLEAISKLTEQTVANDESSVGAQAMEFWTSLAEEEYNRIQKNGQINNYIMSYK